MLVGKDWVFTHNPKAGGTSIKRALRPYATEELKYHGPLWPFSGQAGKRLRFFVVRNPFDRLVSAYHFLHKGHKRSEWPEFNEWVQSPEPAQINNFDIKRQLQLYWAHQGNYPMNFEHLEYQFEHLCKTELGLKIGLPHANASEDREPYQSYYNKKSIEVVEDRFGPDLKTYGYSF